MSGRSDHDCADDRKRPEDIDIGEQIDLVLQRLSDPGDGLSVAFDLCA
jgi:hypothetical protein